MPKYDYDFFVIGGGSGGVRAGRLVAAMGKRVAIAEEHRWGGTCVIRGCVPKKLMVYASHFAEEFEAAKGFGWTVGETNFDWRSFVRAKDREIERLEGLYRKGLEGAQAEVLDTRAELRGPHEVYLKEEDRIVTAEKVLIAVGGSPTHADWLLGHECCIVSDDVFDLETQPESMVIVGGGYIAVEFAGIFAKLGTKVTLIYRGSEILRGFDNDLRTLLHAEMSEQGIKVICDEVLTRVDLTDKNQKHVVTNSGRELIVDEVMLAIGRKPVTKQLGLEQAGVDVDESGFIKVDAYSKTTCDSIWAVGDVTDRVPLTPVAIHESMCLIETEFKDIPTAPDHDLISTAVFSQPEIGTVGLSEEDAAKTHSSLHVFRAHFRPMKNTLSGSAEKMLMKIIVDAQSDIVLGVHIMGPSAAEMAQVLGIALKTSVTKTDFDRTMALHPTAAEELVTMYTPSYRVENGVRVGR